MSAKTPKGSVRIKVQLSKVQAAKFRNAAKNLAKKLGCRQNEAILKALLFQDSREIYDLLRDDEMRNEIRVIKQHTQDIIEAMI